MTDTVTQAVAVLRTLARPSELQAKAEAGWGASRQKSNSHIHLPPNFTAFTTVRQAVELAHQQGVGVLGASNYYDYEVYGDLADAAREHGIFPLFGLEIICLIDELVKAGVKINDPGNPGKFYLCGKGITRFAPMNDEARRLIFTIRKNDSTRMSQMIKRLGDIFATRGAPLELDEPAIVNMIVRRHGCPEERVYLQERHLCQAFQERFFDRVPSEQRIEKLTKVLGAAPKAGANDAVKIQNEIRSHLMKAGKPAFVDETFINFDDAHRLIIELGGIPCYPTLADGTSPICGFETPVEKLIAELKSRRIYAAELIPIRNTPEVLSQYVKAMRAAGLIVVGGTEHNTLDLLPIEPACLNNQPVPDDIKEIFWEGACVVAAHQYLMLHGQVGFTGNCGEARLASLRKLGAAVIRAYQEQAKKA